jgi:hypothetical protein
MRMIRNRKYFYLHDVSWGVLNSVKFKASWSSVKGCNEIDKEQKVSAFASMMKSWGVLNSVKLIHPRSIYVSA